MQFFQSDDMATRIGEAIGTVIAVALICGLIWIPLTTVLQ